MVFIMNFIEKWLLIKLLKRIVRQGNHRRRIIDFYRLLVFAARREFTEDNKPTLDGFLKDCNDEALEGWKR